MRRGESSGAQTVTVRVPMAIRRRGGRKLVLSPDGGTTPMAGNRRHIDNAMIKALARSFRWRQMLEQGDYATIAEIAAAEKINETYVGRVLKLSLLAPDIVEAILTGAHPPALQLMDLFRGFPIEWDAQRATFFNA